MPLTPQEIADLWAQRYAASVDKFEKSINAITTSPMERAVAKKADWIAAMSRKETHDKWEARLKATNLAEWKRQTIKKAKDRMQGGAQDAIPKVKKFMDVWMPHMAQLKTKLDAMPKGKGANNRARMLAAFDHNSGFKYNR